MRIVAGRYRSRELFTPSGTLTRPTTDRAREALFNVLTNLIDFHDANVLDLYAGSGALAFEAISRGAEHATLVENNRKAIESIKKNAKALDIEDEIKVEFADSLSYLGGSPKHYELILVDPPYNDEVAFAEVPPLLLPWLAKNGVAVIEHRTGRTVTLPPDTTIIRELKAGEASFTVFRITLQE